MYIHSRPNDYGNLLITLKYWCKDNDDFFEYRQSLCKEAKRVKWDEAFVIGGAGGPEEPLMLTKGQINRIASEFEDAVKHIDRFNIRRVNVWYNKLSPENAEKGLPYEICSLIADYIG